MRQSSKIKKYDCVKYGNLCGVGRTNIFITKSGIYPCARFMGDLKYRISSFDQNWFDIDKLLAQYKKPIDGECFFDTLKELAIKKSSQ
jgi:uncharacterized protein